VSDPSGRVLVTTVPFGEIDPAPLDLLAKNRVDYDVNPLGRRLRAEELEEMIGGYEALIAGTEPITEAALEGASDLRLIARVGIGLDNVPLAAARRLGIAVTYTPEAPAAAVADLAVGQMLALLRHTGPADRDLRRGVWRRRIGRRLGLVTVGVIGVGRIGKRVVELLQSWRPPRVLVNDLELDFDFARRNGCTPADKETIYREADVITLHVPLTPLTDGLIGERQLAMMRPDACLLNTARGGVVDEAALAAALGERPDLSAAVDVFCDEPYDGPLAGLENCLLTSHMGSGSRDCRARMELEATEEVVRHFRGEPFACPVPESELLLQEGA
jgi:D-3-phosphoglycerate dehydrogenase